MNVTRVHCYAGAGYPERPVAFEWEGAWLEIAEVLRQARLPEGLVFDILADGRRYRLEWNQARDNWSVTLNRSMIISDEGESHV